MARKLDTMKIQVISGPAQVISGPGWAWSMPPWNQESMSPDEVLGPWDPFWGPWDPGWGERAALEAEGRLIGGLGAEPPGISQKNKKLSKNHHVIGLLPPKRILMGSNTTTDICLCHSEAP